MATLEKIRLRAGLVVGAVGLALVAFLAGDLIQGGSTLMRDREMNAFTINGKAVKAQEFDARVRQAEEQGRAQGRGNVDEATMQQIRNQVYQSYVTEQLLSEEADKLGLTISPAETFDLVQGDHVSPVILQLFSDPATGALDKAALLNFLKTIQSKGATPEEQAQLQSYRAMWNDTERTVRLNRLYEKYNALLTKAIATNKLEIQDELNATSTVSDIAYVAQPVSALPDSAVQVSNDDIKKYYDAHKALFRTESGAQVDLIYANVTPSEADYNSARSDVEAGRGELLKGISAATVLDEYSDVPYTDTYLPFSDLQGSSLSSDALTFITEAAIGDVSPVYTRGDEFSAVQLLGRKSSPESLRVRHIVLGDDADQTGTSADSLLTVLRATPASFAQVAEQYSLDRNSSRGGEIGWLNEAMATGYIGADFADAIYSAAVGVPFKYQSNYGTHIVLVEEARPSVDKVKIAYLTRTATPSTETQTLAYNELSNFVSANKGKAGIDSLATQAGFQVLSNIPVAASQPYIAPGIQNSREAVRWAMNNKKGEASNIMEANNQYLVVKVRDKFEAGYAPLTTVSTQLRPVVLAEKKLDTLYDRLSSKQYSDLTAYATEIGSSVDTLSLSKYNTARFDAVGYQPALNAVAAFAPENKVVAVKGAGSVFLTKVISRRTDAGAPTEAQLKQEIQLTRSSAVQMRVMQELIDKADISDRRYKFM